MSAGGPTIADPELLAAYRVADSQLPDTAGADLNIKGVSTPLVVEDEPKARKPAARRSAARPSPGAPPVRARTGRAVSLAGMVLCGFVFFELVGSDVTQARAQTLLRPCLEFRMKAERAGSADTGGDAAQDSLSAFDPSLATDAADAEDAQVSPPRCDLVDLQPGDPLALLTIPRLGLSQVVVEGTDQRQTADGPGHYRASPKPGEAGNVVVVGRRATYGAPFRELGRLRARDRIVVDTGLGRFVYRVEGPPTEIQPGDPDVLGEDGSNRLTLITANQPYAATGRLAVVARADGSGPEPVAADVGAELPSHELGLSRDATAWAPVLVFGQLLVALWWVSRRYLANWPLASRWVVLLPVGASLLVLWFESLSRLFPASL